MANDAPTSPVASPPPAPAPSAPPPPLPQLLGFAEPTADVPPVEDFLPHQEAATAAVAERAEIAASEAAPPAPEPEPEPEIEPGPEPGAEAEPAPVAPPAPVHIQRRELPAAAAAPASPPQDRPQNLVGRLGRRLGDAAAPAAAPAPKVRHLHESRPVPAQPGIGRTDRPSQQQAASDRTGRPSLPRNRRAYRRARVPAEIEIGGVPCTLIDVSIGGFAASGVPQIEPNALVLVTLRLVIDGIEVGTQLSARIVYVTHGRSAGRFIDLSPSQMAFLRYIVTWRGESVGAVGTTTLLDAIAGGADRGFAPGSNDQPDLEAKSRWWAGLIGKKVNPPR